MTSFEVGSRVVYPFHGAGVIEAVERKEVLGEREEYYVLRLPIEPMTVMIPVDDVTESGLRPVVGEEELEQVFQVLADDKSNMSSNWNRRYRVNTEKLKTGDIYELAEVIRNLTARNRERGLAMTERKMLDNAKRTLASELMLAKGIDEKQAMKLLDQVLAEGGGSADGGDDVED